MFIITKAFSFCAAHRIMGLPEGHASGRLHGHTWGVEVVFHIEDMDDRELAANDFAPIQKYLDDTFDHRTILRMDDPLVNAIHGCTAEDAGTVLAFEKNPSAECIAIAIYWSLIPLGFPNVAAVRVSELPGMWVEARMELE